MPLGKFTKSKTTTPTPPTLAVKQFGWDQFLNTSGSSGHSELPANATLGNAVVLAIHTQSANLNDVSSVAAGFGTMTYLSSSAEAGLIQDVEFWWCPSVTTAAKSVNVTSASGSQWAAAAFEISGPPVAAVVPSPAYARGTASASLAITPVEAGDLIIVAMGVNVGSSAISSGPGAGWTTLGGNGLWARSVGADAAWQVAASTSPLTAAYVWGSNANDLNGLIVRA